MARQREFPRHYRVGDQIQRDVAEIIAREIEDPRIPALLTVTAVDLTRDLSLATLFVSVMTDCDRDSLMEALAAQTAHIRTLLARRLRIRSVPALRFRYDDTSERALALSRTIDAALQSHTGNQEAADPESSPGS